MMSQDWVTQEEGLAENPLNLKMMKEFFSFWEKVLLLEKVELLCNTFRGKRFIHLHWA
jgi:hypothetical protein